MVKVKVGKGKKKAKFKNKLKNGSKPDKLCKPNHRSGPNKL